MANAQNLRIGDCDVIYKNIELGYTKGGITLTFEREFADLTADKFGTSALEKALTGSKLMAVVRLAEVTKENLSKAIPEGRFDAAGSDSKLGFGRATGYLLRQHAGELRLHPRNKDVNDRSEDIYLHLAVSTEPIEMDYLVDEQRIVEVTFEALVDDSQPDGFKLGRIGDPDIS